MDCDFTLPENLALGLLIADLFLGASDLTGEDRVLSAQGLRLSWEWVKGHDVDPRLLCEYIDGEANLPFRSTRSRIWTASKKGILRPQATGRPLHKRLGLQDT
jgi:hypothetical protein